MKTKIIGIVLGIILFIILAVGLTYAVYSWATNDIENKYIEVNSNCFNIVYTKGANIGSNEKKAELNIGSDYKSGLSTTVKMSIDSTCNITGVGTLYLNTSEETSDYLIDNNLLNYQVLVGSSKVADGIVTTKGKSIIYDNFTINSSVKSITVYVWISGENVTQENVDKVVNSIYKGTISSSAESRG